MPAGSMTAGGNHPFPLIHAISTIAGGVPLVPIHFDASRRGSLFQYIYVIYINLQVPNATVQVGRAIA